MVKRYYAKELVETELVKIYECPDCGFEFNAIHEADEQVGGWECPLCELEEKDNIIKELTRVLARNLTAWDTSKDKSQGLLPEVYLSNKYWYKQLTGEEYLFSKAVKKFNIE